MKHTQSTLGLGSYFIVLLLLTETVFRWCYGVSQYKKKHKIAPNVYLGIKKRMKGQTMDASFARHVSNVL